MESKNNSQPVAWMYEDLDGDICVSTNKTYALGVIKNVTPLYAHPFDAQAIADAALEVAARLAEDMNSHGAFIAEHIRGLIGQPLAAGSKTDADEGR